jgi:hypothetical protein
MSRREQGFRTFGTWYERRGRGWWVWEASEQAGRGQWSPNSGLLSPSSFLDKRLSVAGKIGVTASYMQSIDQTRTDVQPPPDPVELHWKSERSLCLPLRFKHVAYQLYHGVVVRDR